MRKKVVGITYGEAKTGKTLAAVRAFPDALFVAPPGALLCANWLEWEPDVLDVTGRQGFKFLTDTVKKASGKFDELLRKETIRQKNNIRAAQE